MSEMKIRVYSPILNGKTQRVDYPHKNEQEAHEYVLKQVRHHFPVSPIYVINYKPNSEYYTAIWFVSCDQPKDLSQLVVLAYGNSMHNSKDTLMAHVSTVPWNEVAESV